MRLSDNPTPADPLAPLQADIEQSTAAVAFELELLAEIHERAVRRAGGHPSSPPEDPCQDTPSGP